MDRQKRRVLFAALDQTDIGAIDTHAFGHRFLAEPGCDAVMTHIGAEQLTDIHP